MIDINDLRTAVDDMRAELTKFTRAHKEGDTSAQEDLLWDLREAFAQISDEVDRLHRENRAKHSGLTKQQAERLGDALGMPAWQVLEYWPDALDRLIDYAGSASK